MISPPIFSASASAIADFPTAVGPARKTGRGWRMEDGGWRADVFAIFNPLFSILIFTSAAREEKHQREAGGEHRQTHDLRRSEAVVDVVRRVVAAKMFGDGTEDRVADEIGVEDLPVEFFAAEPPRQREIEDQVQQRVVNFRWMHCCAVRFVVGGT